LSGSDTCRALELSKLQASDSGGGDGKITFQRIIVWPSGHREIEGVTPKALPAPDASHTLPSSSVEGSTLSNLKGLKD
jgi:hypothetical protein